MHCTGHSVPKTASSIKTVYDFYGQYLLPPSIDDTTTGNLNSDSGNEGTLNLSVSRIGTNLQLQFSIHETTNLYISLFDFSGKALYSNLTSNFEVGTHQLMIPLAQLQTSNNALLLNVHTGPNQQTLKLMFSNVTYVDNRH